MASGGTATTPTRLPLDVDLEHTPVLDELGIPHFDQTDFGRTFTTGFEDPADLAGFYSTPQSALTHHETTSAIAHSGTHSEHAWVTGAGGPGLEVDGPNHRGYRAIQLDKAAGGDLGGFRSPSLVQLWVWLDVSLLKGQWFSFATFTNDSSVRWDRVVTVNLDPAGYLNIFHVPLAHQNTLALQRTDILFPMRTWVRLTAYVDLTPAHGAVAVWQNSTLIAAARVDPQVDAAARAARDAGSLPPDRLTDRLEQAHFGLYAPPEVTAATVYNDDLTIAELRTR